MRTSLFTLSLLFQTTLWAQRMDWITRTSSNSSNLRTHMAVDPAGNSFLAGEFSGSITVGPFTFTSANPEDVVLVKIDPQGNVLWAERFWSNNDDQVVSLACDAEGNVLMSVDPSGSSTSFQAADTTFSLPSIGPRTVLMKITADGSVERARLFRGCVFDVAGSDAFVVSQPTMGEWTVERLDGSFGTLWTVSLDQLDAGITSVEADLAGYLVLCTSEFTQDAITIQGVAVPNDPTDANEAIVIRMDLAGTVQWIRTFGASNPMAERVRGSAVGADGRVYIATGSDTAFTFAGSTFPAIPGYDGKVGYLLAYAADGTEDWAIPAYTHFDQATFWDVLVDPQGNVFSSADLVHGGLVNGLSVPDISRPFGLLKCAPDGSTIWLKHPEASALTMQCPAFDLGQGPDGACYLGGFGSNFQLDCTPILPFTGWGYYVLRIVDEPMVAPVAAFTWTPNGLDVQFNNNSTGANGWSWDLGDGTTSTEQAPAHTYSADGTYHVSLTASLGWCTSTMMDTLVLITTSSAEPNGEGLLRSFPDPASTEMRVELLKTFNGTAELTIMDAMGRCVRRQILHASAENIQLLGLATGRYCAQVTTPSWTGRIPFVIE